MPSLPLVITHKKKTMGLHHLLWNDAFGCGGRQAQRCLAVVEYKLHQRCRLALLARGRVHHQAILEAVERRLNGVK